MLQSDEERSDEEIKAKIVEIEAKCLLGLSGVKEARASHKAIQVKV